jgi:hypothetical protein
MADFQTMGGVPDFYGQILNSAQQGLVQLPDGSYAPSPQYGQATNINDIYAGILPTLGVPPIGLQGSKVNRGQPSEFYQPPITSPNQTAYRNSTTGRDIIRDIAPPPIQTASNYSALDTIAPLDINNLGLTRDSFFAKQETPAERAIAEITVRGGNTQGPWKGWGSGAVPHVPLPRSRPFSLASAVGLDFGGAPMLTGEDPWGGLRVGGSKGANRPGMATGTPSGSKAAAQPQKKSFSLFDALVSMSSGGGRATGPQLAAMQSAAPQAQDPALAAALAAGNKSYVPTNGDPTGVLGYGAVMPTVAMNGNPIRNR